MKNAIKLLTVLIGTTISVSAHKIRGGYFDSNLSSNQDQSIVHQLPHSAMVTSKLTEGRQSALIIVDMSVEQVADLSYRKQDTINAIVHLVNNANFDLIVDSHLWIGQDDESSLPDLYPHVGRKGTDGAELIPELKKTLSSSQSDVVFVPKYNYSSFAKPSKLDQILQSHGITDVYVVGINTDYCIFATSLDAFYARYQVYVVEEGVSSALGESGHYQGFSEIAKFGCAQIVSMNDVLQSAPLPERKAISWPP